MKWNDFTGECAMQETSILDLTPTTVPDYQVGLRALEMIAVQLEAAKELRHSFDRECREFVGHALSIPEQLRQQWTAQSERALKLGAEDLFDQRAKLEAWFDERIAVIEQARQLINRWELIAETTSKERELLECSNAESGKIRADVFDGWKTLEELEAKLMRPLRIPPERLARIAELCPPPQEWYEQTMTLP